MNEQQLEIELLEEELYLWKADLNEAEEMIREAHKNIARITRRLSRLTPVAGDAADGAPEHDG